MSLTLGAHAQRGLRSVYLSTTTILAGYELMSDTNSNINLVAMYTSNNFVIMTHYKKLLLVYTADSKQLDAFTYN